ncbi:hypothetical protein BJ508DRAFT_149665 [Ascobolus immersus RN42]|uniref:Secreted protein n=1 Tax=Ascobolus immersus RN42 TaxID=1160509 RepID=A0A3N4INR2_ASCIM|nr:hypothetical protein BJ508DRAFT_149665 [Ascobolus immersus RN42]
MPRPMTLALGFLSQFNFCSTSSGDPLQSQEDPVPSRVFLINAATLCLIGPRKHIVMTHTYSITVLKNPLKLECRGLVREMIGFMTDLRRLRRGWR